MIEASTLEHYLDALLNGDRNKCRNIIERILQSGTPTNIVYSDVIWPIMVEVEKLSKKDKISPSQEHLATRINRTIVDQLQNKLPRRPDKNKRVIVCCAEDEIQELGAQIAADLFESDGWDVKFMGGGLTNEDLLEYVNQYSPDLLFIYGTKPMQAPSIRKLIDKIKNVNAWPEMKIMVSGGIFNRADGLWQEIGADLYAPNAFEAVQIASNKKEAEKPNPTLNKRKRKKKSNAETVKA